MVRLTRGVLVLVGGALTSVVAAVAWVRAQTADFRASDIASAPEGSVAIVLGASVFSSGRPSPVVEDRLATALLLFRAGKVQKILVSGDHGGASYDEVNGMYRWLAKAGIPERDLFLDHAGFRTFDTMVRAAKVFVVRRALVCTQAFHLPRAVFLARRAGIDAVGVEAQPRAASGASLRDLVRESFATLVAVGDVFVWNRQPRFLGPEIPIHGDGRATRDGAAVRK